MGIKRGGRGWGVHELVIAVHGSWRLTPRETETARDSARAAGGDLSANGRAYIAQGPWKSPPSRSVRSNPCAPKKSRWPWIMFAVPRAVRIVSK